MSPDQALRYAARKFFLQEAIMPHEPGTYKTRQLYFTRISELQSAAIAYAMSLGYVKSKTKKRTAKKRARK